MFPLKGCRWLGSFASGIGMSTAVAPTNSQLARVVSKCVLFGTMSPFLHITLNRMRSAARPWCVGITWRNPKMDCTDSRNLVKLGEPAYDSSPRIIAAHCSVDIADVPESVSRSIRIASEATRKRL